jgi:hypothetical protein
MCDFFSQIIFKQEKENCITGNNREFIKNGIFNKNSNQNQITPPAQSTPKIDIEADRFSISSLEKLDISGGDIRDEPFNIINKSKSIPSLRHSMAMSNFNIKNSFYNVLNIQYSSDRIIVYTSSILDKCNLTSNKSLFMKILVCFVFSSNKDQSYCSQRKFNSYTYNDKKSYSERDLNKKFSNKIIKKILAQQDKTLQIKFCIASLIIENTNLSQRLIEEIFINKYKNLSCEEILDISNFLTNLFYNNKEIFEESNCFDLKFSINLDEIIYLNKNYDFFKKPNQDHLKRNDVIANLKKLHSIIVGRIKNTQINNNSILNHILKILEINIKFLNQSEQGQNIAKKTIITLDYLKIHKENLLNSVIGRDNIILENQSTQTQNSISFKDKNTLELLQKNSRKFNFYKN